MDVKSSFLNGDFFEDIYMEKPPRFMIDSSLVYLLKKLLYGLKYDPPTWYEKVDCLFSILASNIVNLIIVFMCFILKVTY